MKKRIRKKRKKLLIWGIVIIITIFCTIAGARKRGYLFQEYPKELLTLYAQNKETKNFVFNYPKKKGKVYADTIGDIETGNIPLLLQWDERWGYGNYGNSLIALNGCGPTSLSMVIAGLTGSNELTPYDIAKYAEENGYYVQGVGTAWDLFTQGSQAFGVQGTELSLTRKAVFQSLETGHPIICSMTPGDFTTKGHFIVLTGIQDGKIKVNDPNSKSNSEKLWEYDTLESQIKNLWTFS